MSNPFKVGDRIRDLESLEDTAIVTEIMGDDVRIDWEVAGSWTTQGTIWPANQFSPADNVSLQKAMDNEATLAAAMEAQAKEIAALRSAIRGFADNGYMRAFKLVASWGEESTE